MPFAPKKEPPKSAWKAIAAGGAVLGALGIAVLATRRSAPLAPLIKRVALIGDSYAVGLGPELSKLLTNFKSEGHEGTNTGQWASASPACGQCGAWLTSFKPDVALVSLGVNDGLAPNPANYASIVRALRSIGARVVWLEPPAGVSTTKTDTAAVRKIISSLGVPTIPATASPIAADKLHPQSYRQWASEIAAALGAPAQPQSYGEAKTATPFPVGYRRLTPAEITPALQASASSVQSSNGFTSLAYGTIIPIDSKNAALVEQHYHEPGGPVTPWGYHHGVTLITRTT